MGWMTTTQGTNKAQAQGIVHAPSSTRRLFPALFLGLQNADLHSDNENDGEQSVLGIQQVPHHSPAVPSLSSEDSRL